MAIPGVGFQTIDIDDVKRVKDGNRSTKSPTTVESEIGSTSTDCRWTNRSDHRIDQEM